MRGLWEETPFAVIVLCLMAGILSSGYIESYSFALLVLSTFALLAASLAAFVKDRRGSAAACALTAIVLCGTLLAIARRDGYSDMDVRAFLARTELPLNQPVLFEGCVTEEALQYDTETRVTVDLRAIQRQGTWLPCHGLSLIHIPIIDAKDESIPGASLHLGDLLRGWAIWQVPHNYRNPGAIDRTGYLARHGIHLTGRVKSPRLLEVIPQDCANLWSRQISAAKNRLLRSGALLEQQGSRQPAAILASLIVGDYSQLSSKTREIFQNAGTYHVLVVSGMHIAWIAWVLSRLIRLVRFRPLLGDVFVAFCIFFYTSIVGFQASIFRSLWMFIIYLAGRLLVRRCLPVNIVLASAFAILVVRPDWLVEPGFQLSFLSVIAICVTGLPFIDRVLHPLLQPVRHAGDEERLFLQPGSLYRFGRLLRIRCELFAEACGDALGSKWQSVLLALFRAAAGAAAVILTTVAITAAVQVWIEPVLAYHFNRLSWIAPLSNLIVVPLSSLILATGAIASLTAEIPRLGTALVFLAGRLAEHFLGVTQWISEIPGAWQRCPTPPLSWILGSIILLFCWNILRWSRPWIPSLIVALLLSLLAAGIVPQQHDALSAMHGGAGKPLLKLTFLDVGEGDSIVIQFPNRKIWVLDAGGMWQAYAATDDSGGFDIGESVVSRYLWALGSTKLDRLILSHPDRDHAGGMPALFRNFHIGRFAYGEGNTGMISRRLLEEAEESATPLHRLHLGDLDEEAGVTSLVLNAPERQRRKSTNEDSVVFYIVYGRFTALLTGDLEKSSEQLFVSRYPDLRAGLLKVAHHGSRFSTMQDLLHQLRPRWGIISAGRGNPFGHPSPQVLDRMIEHRVRPLTTLDEGAITFETDGHRYILAGYATGILEEGLLP